jgi:hypothetical protein
LIYNINRFVLQERGDFTWSVSDCEELVGGFTGDDGVSLPFVLLEQLLDHKISHVYDQQVHEII